MPSSKLCYDFEHQMTSPQAMSVSSGGGRRLPGQRGRLQHHGRHHHRSEFHTDHDTDHRASSPKIGQRSQSLSALQPAAVIQPRMAQLETLEAKMASIEVSLSAGTPRRKKCLPLTSPSPRSFLGGPTTPLDQLEGLRNALRDKENIIRSLRGQAVPPNNNNNINNVITNNVKSFAPGNNKELLSNDEKKHLEERLQRLKQDTDNKRLAIKNLKLALDKLDITDNIDIRIQQAELEYQLGREELNLLTLLEESRSLQNRLDDASSIIHRAKSHHSSVHSVVTSMGGSARLLALEVTWSTEEPRFGTAVKPSGVFVEWSDRETGLHKGDRVVEINGKLLVTRTPSLNDLNRLFALCPNPAQMLVLRSCDQPQPSASSSPEVASLRSELGLVRERAEEAQRSKDSLRADNLRLTHRISYLEEQVQELLDTRRQRHKHNLQKTAHQLQEEEKVIRVVTKTNLNHKNVTNINIGNGNVEVFQKGNQMTALLGNNRPNRAPSSPCIAASEKYSTDDELKKDFNRDARSVKSLELDNTSFRSSRKSIDYTSEPSSGFRKRPTPPKKPVRLSLHRAQSLQSVEPLDVFPMAKSMSSHQGETPSRKRSRDKSVSGLRWQNLQIQKQTARWC